MNILIIGLGSIGKRHLNNLISLGYSKVSVVTSNSQFELNGSGVKYSDIETALKSQQFDAAILCTPTAVHVPAIIQLLKAKIYRIYIEKPVSHNLDKKEEILQLAASYNNKIIVGYDLHFDPGLQKVNELLKEGAIGKTVSVNAVVGQYLPDWRPHEDYRQGMSAKVATGGGVMLDLVHEFDYLYWLFGSAKQIASFNKNSGVLEIETEDVAEVIINFENGMLGSIHLDYLQQKLVRNCVITGSKGSIFWDLASTTVRWLTGKDGHEFIYSHAQRNDRFIEIMKSFFGDVPDSRLTTIQQAYESLGMVVAAKQSSDKQVFVTIN